MTEELKQKAEEWVYKNTICYGSVSVLPTRENAYIAGATEATKELQAIYKKQRNKRIDELQKKNNDLENKLANADYQLEGRDLEIKELNKKLSQAEADYDKMFWQKNETISNLQEQIEKMKCCENCKHSNTTCECYTICTIGHYDDCKSNTVLDSLDKKDYWEN